MLGARPTVLVAVALGLASCLGGPTNTPEGFIPLGGHCGNPEDTRYCEKGLMCAWGRCRLTCQTEADCLSGLGCVAGPSESAATPYDWERRVCLVAGELSCGVGDPPDCPVHLYCHSVLGTCRAGCDETLLCPAGHHCDIDEAVCVPGA